MVSQRIELDKLNNYFKITGILYNVLRPQKPLRNKNKIIQYTGPPVLLFGSEIGSDTARDGSRLTAAEIKYMRRTAGYIWTDCKTNTQIAKT
jgi:hypothetical protein